MVFRFLVTNFEVIVSCFLIVLQVMYGALENLVVLGILFFLILAENNMGYAKWWRVLLIIYLIKCFLKFSTMHFLERTGSTSPTVTYSIFSLLDILTVFFAKMDYQADIVSIILIFVLLSVLQKSGISTKRISMYEDPGTAVARLVLSKKKAWIFEKHSNF